MGHDSKLKGLSTGLYMYLANPLTIVLHTQLDIAIETIAMKVISQKRNEKGVIAESSGWRPPLHSASAAFCERLTLFNQYNALWVGTSRNTWMRRPGAGPIGSFVKKVSPKFDGSKCGWDLLSCLKLIYKSYDLAVTQVYRFHVSCTYTSSIFVFHVT